MGMESGARIVLPETNDKRIQEAVTELISSGFAVLNHDDFQKITLDSPKHPNAQIIKTNKT